MWFLHVEWQTRRVPNTRPKTAGYGYVYEFLPIGMGTITNFYAQHLYWWTSNYSTRPVAIPRAVKRVSTGKKLTLGRQQCHTVTWHLSSAAAVPMAIWLCSGLRQVGRPIKHSTLFDLFQHFSNRFEGIRSRDGLPLALKIWYKIWTCR
jgi:hypothetical protein